MDFRADVTLLRQRWARLAAKEQADLAEGCGWSTQKVALALNSTRVFDTTPVGDLDALRIALGLPCHDDYSANSELPAIKRRESQVPPRRRPEADLAARQALKLLDRRRPPVDVYKLAEIMGVDRIDELPSAVDGRLLAGPDETVIEVSSQHSWARKRFTIAHELGHLWLAQGRVKRGAAPLAWREEERFCDEFAAALLMPKFWLRKRALETDCNLRTLEILALEARTSCAATLIRLRAIDPRWNVSLLKFRPGVDVPWRLVSINSPSSGLVGRLRCHDKTNLLLSQARGAGTPVKGSLWLTLDSEPLEAPAEVVGKSPRTLLVLARLPKSPRKPATAWHTPSKPAAPDTTSGVDPG